MPNDTYRQKITQALHAYDPVKFSDINNLDIIKGLNFEAAEYSFIADSIKRDGIEVVIKLVEPPQNKFEYLTILTFSDQTGRRWIAMIYDSDELGKIQKFCMYLLIKRVKPITPATRAT